MRKNIYFLCLCALCTVLTTQGSVFGQLYITGKRLEVDKLASIWLIKRFIDKDAEFVFTDRGEKHKDGIPFDAAYARLRRSANRSTFEIIVQSYRLRDKTLQYMGNLIHDIEINSWEKKRFKETPDIQLAIGMIMKQDTSRRDKVSSALAYFDSLYVSLRQKQP